MTLTYTRIGTDGWFADIGPIRMFLSDENADMNKSQVVVAAVVAASLSAIREKGAAYLDLFVDRQKACGRAEEPWFLDTVEFREHTGQDPVCYSLLFGLDGDDGGMWTVDMRAHETEHRPFRFERRQG